MNYRKIICMMLLSMISIVTIKAESPKWELACQSWTFKEFTLEETLAKMESLGIKYIEIYPKQVMSKSDSRTTYFNMPAEQIMELQAMLKEHGIKVISYGVVSPNKIDDWLDLFKFAKKIGIKTIVSEPKEELLPEIDLLCKKYDIQVAIHNHSIPTHYSNPATVKKALEGRSKYIGVCADLGHWSRSGLIVEDCLKSLSGRIIEIHMKDEDKMDESGKAVVWGKGVINWDRVITELREQGFKGKFVIEHETNWNNPIPDLKKNIAFFKSIK